MRVVRQRAMHLERISLQKRVARAENNAYTYKS